jgi:ribosomal protein L1
MNTINEVKPSGSKGKYINTIFVCNAMWPSIRIDTTK